MYSVYKHTCPNNKVYIGITSKEPKKRWAHGYRNNNHFSNAIKFYGWENIKHEILFTGLTKEEAEIKEIELIALYDSTDQAKGYNISKGGHSNFGYHHSDEVKKKIVNSLTGKKHTPERCLHRSESLKRRWNDPEYRKQMIEVHKGLQSGKNHSMSKKIDQYSLDGNYIRTFDSMGEAERITGIRHQQISECCRKLKESCHGYIWKFSE